jgi:hypothetical protein
MRTQQEIAARIREVQPHDFFGFSTAVLVFNLDFENAKEFLKPDATPDDWPPPDARTEAAIRKEAVEYLDFAWDKAKNHRGISASRSIQKMTEYLWLLGLDDASHAVREAPHRNYGAPGLKVAAMALGLPLPTDAELVRMMDSLPCREDCNEGCGQ